MKDVVALLQTERAELLDRVAKVDAAIAALGGKAGRLEVVGTGSEARAQAAQHIGRGAEGDIGADEAVLGGASEAACGGRDRQGRGGGDRGKRGIDELPVGVSYLEVAFGKVDQRLLCDRAGGAAGAERRES